MIDLQLVFLCISIFLLYNVLLWWCFGFIHNSGIQDGRDYYENRHKVDVYKQNMLDAQNTAKQYKSALKGKKKAYKSLQRSYSCLEQENKCLKAKLCEKEDLNE